ncbi:MAG: 4-hydroxy-tetrahydrodipicolinate reductase [Nitrospirota bacterium]
MINAIVTGASGRMGKRIINLIHDKEGISLIGAVERKESPAIGRDAGEIAGLGNTGISIGENIEDIIKRADVVIDFTTPSAAMSALKIASANKKAMVIGTTGFTQDELNEIDIFTKDIPLVFSPNMSIGVNIVFKTIGEIAKILGGEYDMEIIEAHHRNKKDSPSGTAMKMGEILAQSTNRDLEKVGKYSRHGITGERKRDEIGIQSIRAGDIVGEHTVIYCGNGERIEITHKAHSRDNFALGAIRAAEWIVSKRPGLYDMLDVLGLQSKPR